MATTKNELTQIKALEVVIAEDNGRAEDVQAKLVEVYNALVKKKENRKPKRLPKPIAPIWQLSRQLLRRTAS